MKKLTLTQKATLAEIRSDPGLYWPTSRTLAVAVARRLDGYMVRGGLSRTVDALMRRGDVELIQGRLHPVTESARGRSTARRRRNSP